MQYSVSSTNQSTPQVIFEPLAKISNVLRRFIPCGKIAIFADSNINFSEVNNLRKSLKSFESFVAILNREESATGLFSLPDDVRAVIAFGVGTFGVARYFCTLRGAYCICVPERADMRGAFENLVDLSVGNSHSLYPANEPDAVLCDADFLKDTASAFGELALCAVISLDFEINSVFSGGGSFSAYSLLFNLALSQNSQDIQGILNLYAQYLVAEKNTKLYTPSAVFCQLLSKKTGIGTAQSAYFTYVYFIKRYKYFFESAKPRTFFVPEYANRIRNAARISGIDERALFLKNKVPTVKRCDALFNTFCESRKTFALKCETAVANLQKIKNTFFSMGVKAPQIPFDTASEIFSVTAELSDILSVPSLMRDFGLLCNG